MQVFKKHVRNYIHWKSWAKEVGTDYIHNKGNGKFVTVHNMKGYGKVEVLDHIFLTSVIDVDEWSASCTTGFNLCEKEPLMPTEQEGCASLHTLAKRKDLSLPGIKLCLLSCTACSLITVLTALSKVNSKVGRMFDKQCLKSGHLWLNL